MLAEITKKLANNNYHACESQNYVNLTFKFIIKHSVEVAIDHKGLPFTTNPKPRALLCIQPPIILPAAPSIPSRSTHVYHYSQNRSPCELIT